MQSYIDQISNLTNPTFQGLRRIANSQLSHFSKDEREKLRNSLIRGTAILDSHEQMCQYLYSYGNMHQAKLLDAFKNLPNTFINQPFEIIDWGCGQAMGTVNLFDYMNELGCIKNIKKVTLIEPSKSANERGILHSKAYVNDTVQIESIQDFFENIKPSQIKSSQGLPVLHIFSNILDVAQIDLKHLAKLIDSSILNDNYIVSVGPVYANSKRLDAFYNYFDVPLIYDKEDSQFDYGGYNPCSYKAKIYKLSYHKEGNLIPIEFYPSVQFHSAYELDCVKDQLEDFKIEKVDAIRQKMTVFETSTPFDIGASVYDDIHPILAVLNNIITRGLPTKCSPFVENIFKESFGYSNMVINYGAISYNKKESFDYENVLHWYNSIISDGVKVGYDNVSLDELQLVYSPIAIARVQKTVLEALMTDKLDFNHKTWKILVDEKDVPAAAIAFRDLAQMFNNLSKLSTNYEDLVFPNFELDIISNETFVNSKLHLDNNVFKKANPIHKETTYDLVIDISVFKISSIEKESFSTFKCKNNAYFNIRSTDAVQSERVIYTTDNIKYKNIVTTDGQGNFTEISDTKEILEYFVQLLFRKEGFRPGQLPILNRALQNKSVIGLLPTGGGKSLTYQLAAMLQPGVTLIVDPLRSLMKDQYDGLINIGIDTCAYINSTLPKEDKEAAERKMEQSKLLFVFLSPERLSIYKFREKLKNMHNLNVYFSYGVIDEVHCVSEWGHDFRFSYLHLGRNLYNYVRAKEGVISLFGLTATASFDVLADVERELSGNGAFPLDSETIVRYENSNRLELQYKIEKVNIQFEEDPNFDKKKLLDSSLPSAVKISNKWGFFDAKNHFLKNYVKQIPDYLNNVSQKDSIENIKKSFEDRQGNKISLENDLSTEIAIDYYAGKEEYKQAGIIFCPHKQKTGISVEENKRSLIDFIPDIGTFSGGDDNNNSSISMNNLELFRDNKQPLMVATKAFGMGIDKPNVRFTVNLNYSSSLESFVQEAGRAGRDKAMALSVILLSDYKLARLSPKYNIIAFPVGIIRGKWFRPEDLDTIISFYDLEVSKQDIDYLTPQNDLVRLFCKEGTHSKYFAFNQCQDTACKMFDKCNLRKVPTEGENWVYKKDLEELLLNNNIKIDKKYIEYHNADYETVMYFYNNSFKGEIIEKKAMQAILNINETDVFYTDNTEINTANVSTVKGFLTTLLNSKENQEIVSFIKYTPSDIRNGIEGTDTDIAKAIYRMTCIELIEDFTQDYANDRYRIVSKRKNEESYYNGLKRFLKRYYSEDRVEEEIKKVYQIKVKSEIKLEREIFQCLSFLTTFVYDKISVKRKRAIDDMRTFCITGANDSKDWKETNEELKDFIFYYFNSKYAKRDYEAANGQEYSLMLDTDEGKDSADWILFKYLKIINDAVEDGTPIDNVKHLQGAVRLLRRSLTDENPTLSLLSSFCIFFLGTNNNENLEIEVLKSYEEGMIGFSEREEDLVNFWKLFDKFNKILEPFSGMKLKELKAEIMLKVHNNEINNLATKYLQ